MTETKLFFGSVLEGQSLGFEFEKDLEDFSASIRFKEITTGQREALIGNNPNETAQNYVDALVLDYSILTDITITVLRNVVTFSYDETVLEIKYFYGTTISSGTVSEKSINIFNLKYWFEFTDVKEVKHRVEIYKESGEEPIQIYGTCSLEYSETKDSLEAIRGCGLKIDLEANSGLTFSELYSEEERTFSVIYKRDDKILFNGWLSPEGIYESLVADKWIISLDCTDGIGFLNNLSYVDDNGLTFSGKQSMLEIVVNCLKRTRTLQDIYVYIDVIHDGMNPFQDVLTKTFLNADRFIKDDGDTIMNCEEVLRSILEIFGAILVSYEGKWLICKPNRLVDRQNIFFYAYDSDGVELPAEFNSIDFSASLGSQIDGFYPHHVNGNQQKTITNSIGAFRINYKYGFIKTIIENIYLKHDDLNIEEYTITDRTNLNFLTSQGVEIKATSTPQPVFRLTKAVEIGKDDVLSFFTKFALNFKDNFASFRITLTTANETYYLSKTDKTQTNQAYTYLTEWITSDNVIKLESPALDNIPKVTFATLIIGPSPEDGLLNLEILTPGPSTDASPFTKDVRISEISLTPLPDDINVKGETHTFQRIGNPSSKIAKNKEVFNGDSPSTIYEGAIFKANKTTPTELWRRLNDLYFEKSILRIMGEERMKMYARPRQVFSGDVFGYFNYLSVFTINNLDGLFMATAYNYNAATNITSLKLTEIIDPFIYDDIDYKFEPEYKEVVEPTIKG